MAVEVGQAEAVKPGIIVKTGKAVAEKAHGKPLSYYKSLNLPKEIEFTFKYQQYTEDAAGEAALVANKDEMTLAEQVKARNVAFLNNARSKEREAEFLRRGIIKPTEENDLSIAYKNMLKTLTAVKLPDGSKKFTQAQAEEQAAMLTGYDPNAPEADNSGDE